jgi:hypothetical protein
MNKFLIIGVCTVVVAAALVASTEKSTTSRPLATATTVEDTTSAPAQSADTFVDALGVDTHFGYDDTIYRYLSRPAPSGNTVVSVLKTLGVRRIRDGGMDQRPSLCPIYRTVIANGANFDALTNPTTDTTALRAIVACLGSGLSALEAPNERDTSGDKNWAQADLAEMRVLIANRGTTFPASVNLIGPSATSEAGYAALAAIDDPTAKAGIDFANTHIYFPGREPETKGWGRTDPFGTYGAVTTTRNWAISNGYPPKPWVSTETGYRDDPGETGYVTPALKTKYLLRDLLTQWQAGAQRIYIYELADEHGSWGLLDSSLRPKPAYTAIKNLITILSDPGPPLGPGAFRYTVRANPDVQHLLLHKRDGSFWIWLWQTDPGWDPRADTPIIVPSTTATLTFENAPTKLTKYAFTPEDGSVTVTDFQHASTFITTVTDTPELIQIGKIKKPIILP